MESGVVTRPMIPALWQLRQEDRHGWGQPRLCLKTTDPGVATRTLSTWDLEAGGSGVGGPAWARSTFSKCKSNKGRVTSLVQSLLLEAPSWPPSTDRVRLRSIPHPDLNFTCGYTVWLWLGLLWLYLGFRSTSEANTSHCFEGKISYPSTSKPQRELFGLNTRWRNRALP